jgi:hypothetical protein
MQSRGRLIKSPEARVYEAKIDNFYMYNKKSLDLISTEIKGSLIRVDMYFVFLYSKIIGKEGQVKQTDYSNRVKQSQDGLARCLQIDDKMVKCGFLELVTCDKEDDEQIIFKISKIDRIRTIDELKERLWKK